LLLVSRQGRTETIGKFADKRDRPFVAWKMCLLGAVDDLLEDKEGDDEGKDGSGRGFAKLSADRRPARWGMTYVSKVN
jgi:hypothetical protein